MPKPSSKIVADLYCGGGGTSSGAKTAFRRLKAQGHIAEEPKLIAVNHWDLAIQTHSGNHPDVQHFCADLESVDPIVAVPDGRLWLLMASPECTHHSSARGGKPMLTQKRAGAMYILHWAQKLYIDNIIIENVKEWRDWGPLNAKGLPIRSRKGELFLYFLNGLTALDYVYEYQVLNCADYGAPTTRERLFLQAKKKRKGVAGGVRITWPEPTHRRPGGESQHSLFGEDRLPWVSARTIIDWSTPSRSVFGRKKPLAETTVRRIMAGFEKWGKNGEPFIVALRKNLLPRSVDEPIPTVTAGGNQIGLAEGFIMKLNHDGPRSYPLDRPIHTITTEDASGIVTGESFLVSSAHGLEKKPETAKEEFLVSANYGNRKNDSNPHTRRSHSLEDPIGTIVGSNNFALVEGFIAPVHHGKSDRSYSLDEPMKTITTVDGLGLVEGQSACEADLLAKYYGTGATSSVDDPIDTITSKDRFGLVEGKWIRVETEGGDVYYVDIRFRMLQPKELALGQSFEPGYYFAGNRDDVVKQIGNAVPPKMMEALVYNMMKPEAKRKTKDEIAA